MDAVIHKDSENVNDGKPGNWYNMIEEAKEYKEAEFLEKNL